MKSNMVRILVALVLLMSVTAVAYATTVTLNEYAVQPGTGVNITMPYIGTVNAQTGEYLLSITASGIWNGNYAGFCVDPAYAPGAPTSYDLRAVPENSNYEAAAWLFNKYGSAVTGTYNATVALNVQLAIWEIVIDGVSGKTTTGNFTVNNSGLASSSQVYVTEAKNNFNAAAFDQSAFHLVVNPLDGDTYGSGYQDYIIYKPVPEPISLLLLGIGLIGLAGLRRKYKN